MEKHRSQEWDSLWRQEEGGWYLCPSKGPQNETTAGVFQTSRFHHLFIGKWSSHHWLTPQGFFKQLSPHKWQAEVNCMALIEDCQKYQLAGGGRTWVFCTSELLAPVWCIWSAVSPELLLGNKKEGERNISLGLSSLTCCVLLIWQENRKQHRCSEPKIKPRRHAWKS